MIGQIISAALLWPFSWMLYSQINLRQHCIIKLAINVMEKVIYIVPLLKSFTAHTCTNLKKCKAGIGLKFNYF